MVLFLIIAALIVPPLVTTLLPLRWFLLWLPLLAVVTAFIFSQLEGADGPAGFVAYVLVSLFAWVSWPVALFRIVRTAAQVLATKSGYLTRD